MIPEDHCEAIKKKKSRKRPGRGKSWQELYNDYIREGDAAVIDGDITLAEKCYQYADHFLQMMKNSGHTGREIGSSRLPSSLLAKKIIQALQGIIVERAARQLDIRRKTLYVAKALKAMKQQLREIRERPIRARAARVKQAIGRALRTTQKSGIRTAANVGGKKADSGDSDGFLSFPYEVS